MLRSVQAWAIHEPWLKLMEMAAASDRFAKLVADPKAIQLQADVGVKKTGKIAVVPVHGVLTKDADIWMMIFGGTSSAQTRGTLEQLIADPEVSGILLHVDSPGGQVAGIGDLGDVIAASSKPIHAYGEDLVASAAMWVASQAGHFTASPHAEVGSIGVYQTIWDQSEAAKQIGIQVHVVKAGAFKGIGVAGTEVTDAQLKEVQRNVDATYDHFVTAVARGRKMDEAQVRKLADGRVHYAADAQKLGLVDKVGTFHDALSTLAKAAGLGPINTAVAMKMEEPKSSTMPVNATSQTDTTTAFDAPSTGPELHVQVPIEPAGETPTGSSRDPGADSSTQVSEPMAPDPTPADPTKAATEVKPEDIAAMRSEQAALKADIEAMKAAKAAERAEKLATLRHEVLATNPTLTEEDIASFNESQLAVMVKARAKGNPLGATGAAPSAPKKLPHNDQAARDAEHLAWAKEQRKNIGLGDQPVITGVGEWEEVA